MATRAWNKFNDFSEQLVRGVHDFDANTFKVALVANTDTPVAGDATLLFYMTQEGQEGRDAYKEKRAPDFGKFPKRP